MLVLQPCRRATIAELRRSAWLREALEAEELEAGGRCELGPVGAHAAVAGSAHAEQQHTPVISSLAVAGATAAVPLASLPPTLSGADHRAPVKRQRCERGYAGYATSSLLVTSSSSEDDADSVRYDSCGAYADAPVGCARARGCTATVRARPAGTDGPAGPLTVILPPSSLAAREPCALTDAAAREYKALVARARHDGARVPASLFTSCAAAASANGNAQHPAVASNPELSSSRAMVRTGESTRARRALRLW